MKNLLNCTVLIVSCILTVNALRWKDCGSAGSKVAGVTVAGCAKVDICPLAKGKNASFSVSFTTSEDFSKATAVVHGILAGIPVPFEIPNPNGCQDCGITCPVKSGTSNSYTTNIFIKEAYPKVRVVVKWELKDEKNKDIFCVEIPAEVVDGNRRSVNSIP